MAQLEVGEMNTRFQITDSLALLSPSVMERIMDEAMKRWRMEQAHEQRVTDERRMRSSVSDREEEMA